MWETQKIRREPTSFYQPIGEGFNLKHPLSLHMFALPGKTTDLEEVFSPLTVDTCNSKGSVLLISQVRSVVKISQNNSKINRLGYGEGL